MSQILTSVIKGVAGLVSVSVVYAFWKLFYNVFLHPLRSYPGPLLARATVLYNQRVTLKGKKPYWIHELHLKYGPVVRYSPNELSCITAEAWKDSYGHGPKATAFEKTKAFYGPDIFGSPPGLIRSDNIGHAKQRKLVSHAFSDKAMRDQESLLKGYVQLLIEKLKGATEKSEDGKVDMVPWYNFTTFDIMADLTFGEPLKLLEGSKYTPWVWTFFENLKLIQINAIIRSWPLIAAVLDRFIPEEIKAKRKVHMMHSVEKVDKRLATKTERPDIWTFILRHQNDEENKGKGLTQTEMYSNAGLFMTAGTETTATELSGMTYYLLHDEKRMARVVKEVRDAFSSYDDMHMNSLAQCHFLNACIEEALRIYPPVAIMLPRTTPKDGANVAGNWVPGNTTIGITHYAAYRSPLNFKNPEKYIPERWLPEGQAEYGSDKKEVFQPFSYGPRNCLGKNLAYLEMRLIFASIVLHFDLELCPESEGWLEQPYYVLWKKGPLMVKLKPVRG